MPEFAFNRPQESTALSDRRRLSGQHIQAPRGLPLPGTGATNIPVHLNYTRGLASSLLHDPPTATSTNNNNINAANMTGGPRPPLTYEAQPRLVRPPPVNSTQAAQEWHKLEDEKARKAREEAAAGNSKPLREVDSRTGSKAVPTEKATLRAQAGTIHGATAIRDTGISLRGSPVSQHTTASQSSRSPIPLPGSPCVVPPGGPRYVIRRVDPTVPLPQRPSGRPPVVVTGPTMFHAMHPRPLPVFDGPKPDIRAARVSVTSLMGLQRTQEVGRGERFDDDGSGKEGEKAVSAGRLSMDGGVSARVVAPESYERPGGVVRAKGSSHMEVQDGAQATARLDVTASKTIETKTQRKRHTRSSVETVLSVESTEFAAPSARPISRSLGDRSALGGRQSMSHEETLAMLEGRGARTQEHDDEGAEVLPETRKAVWSMFWDEEVEAEYYYNALTGEATWIKPPDFDGRSDFYVTAEIEGAVEAAAAKC